VVATKTVDFAAPEEVILIGAMLGGLIFATIAFVRSEETVVNGGQGGRWSIAKKLGNIGLRIAGSILLSVIVTVLLSRIAETQFFIKVSVSDLWGAIAVGFLANYGGWALLDKMIPQDGKSADAKKKEIQTASGPVVT
jgi:hypothetical protein